MAAFIAERIRAGSGSWGSVIGDLAVIEVHDVAWNSVSHTALVGTQDNGTIQQRTPAGTTTWDVIAGSAGLVGGDVAIDNVTNWQPATSQFAMSAASISAKTSTTTLRTPVISGDKSSTQTITSSAPHPSISAQSMTPNITRRSRSMRSIRTGFCWAATLTCTSQPTKATRSLILARPTETDLVL